MDKGWRGRRGLIAMAAAIVAVLYLAGWFATGRWMPAHATIGGIDVSHARPSAAAAKVRAALAAKPVEDIELAHGKKRFTLDPRELGLAVDIEESVAAAGGTRSWDPRAMLALLGGTHDAGFVVNADQDELDAAVTAIAREVDSKVVQPQITFPEGKAVARKPRAGLLVQKKATDQAIRAAYRVATDPVAVPVRRVAPAVDQAGLDEAMAQIGKPAVSGPIALHAGDQTYELPVSAYAPALSVRVQDGALKPFLDAKALAGPLTDSTTGIGEQAVDARIDIVDGKPKIFPGKPGVGLNPEVMTREILPVLTKTGADRSLTLDTSVVQPAFTTEEAKSLNITEKMGEFTTNYPHATYRNVNQGRAAELIDGTLLKPGETFSLNDIVGRRTKANGFVDGFVISGGVFREELGGGVSQVATTVYNAAFFAGLEDVEHHPHQFYIDRYPVGREATIYWGHLDLRFRNNTDNGVLVKATLTPSTPSTQGAMHVELWGTKVWDIEAGLSERRNSTKPKEKHDDSDECVPSSPSKGFTVDVFRYFKRDGKTVKTEKDTVRYAPTPEVICDDDDDD